MKAKAFTLMELLVVITIILMLVAIIVPAVNRVKESARTVLCSSNLRQLHLLLGMYDQDNGMLPRGFDDSSNLTSPPKDGYRGDASYDKQGLWWFQLISDGNNRIRQKSEAWCPASNLKNVRLRNNILCGNYGINRSICKDSGGITGVIGSEFVGKPLSLSSINNPSGTLLLVDSGYSIISWRGASDIAGPVFDNPRRESAFYIPGLSANKTRMFLSDSDDALNGRHPNKTVNTVFVDGHLNRVKADELLVEDDNGTYKNRSPLWVPK